MFYSNIKQLLKKIYKTKEKKKKKKQHMFQIDRDFYLIKFRYLDIFTVKQFFVLSFHTHVYELIKF